MLNLVSLIIIAACLFGVIPAVVSHWLACKEAKRSDYKAWCDAKDAQFAARLANFKRIHKL